VRQWAWPVPVKVWVGVKVGEPAKGVTDGVESRCQDLGVRGTSPVSVGLGVFVHVSVAVEVWVQEGEGEARQGVGDVVRVAVRVIVGE